MPDSGFHLAQLNIGRLKAPLDSPAMKEFVDFLDPVNRFAEESPGFVWRLAAQDGMPSSYLPPAFDDEMIAVNMTVWKDIESLRTFVYQTVHVYFLRNRKRWFEIFSGQYVVLWWIPEGHHPDVEEAKQKLKILEENGPTAQAFTLQKAFDHFGNPYKPSADEV